MAVVGWDEGLGKERENKGGCRWGNHCDVKACSCLYLVGDGANVVKGRL